MTDVVVDRVRIRGTGAHRLAAVAARALPAALEDALADLADGALDSLDVRLDLDPADYDDATLAVLWADRIRSAALAAGAQLRGSSDPSPEPTDATATHPLGPAAVRDDARGVGSATGTEAHAAAIRDWLEVGAPATAVPRCVAALAEASVADAVLARLGASGARELARALNALATQSRATLLVGPRFPDPAADPQPGDAPARHAPADPLPVAAAAGAAGSPPSRPASREVVAGAAAVHPHLELAVAADPTAPTADLAAASVAAGLVLCYPWLADLCRDAERHHRHAEPSHVRRVALAVLAAGPGDHADLLDDPLVRFLAGADADAGAASALAWLDTEPLAELADAVLARFAALLRGFERSTPTFVRASWLLRPGVLDTDRDPVRLLAATMPVDVVLHLLPFPVSLLRLPWTPPLSVRFVP